MTDRQIVLDTETTGLRVDDGHRIIEIGCVELIDRRLTGKTFHEYINPGREVDSGAQAVHGITTEFLQDKPLFNEISNRLMTFIDGSELIIHNASFDLSFLDHELLLSRQGWKKVTHYCQVTDTLQIARKLHVGQRNSLDALCKRYYIDNSKREYHGALLDAHLLAQVYLAMTGGQGSFFDLMNDERKGVALSQGGKASTPVEKHELSVVQADDSELSEHERYLDLLQKKGKCLWRVD